MTMNIQSKLDKIKVKIDILEFHLKNSNLSDNERTILAIQINELLNKINLMTFYSNKFNDKKGILNEL